MLVRRDALERLGGFDEGFFLYCEDMDLCRRAARRRPRVRYEPGAVARHEGGHSAPRTSLFAGSCAAGGASRASTPAAPGRALQHLGLAVGALTHIAAALGRPAHARGHAAALRAALDRRPG